MKKQVLAVALSAALAGSVLGMNVSAEEGQTYTVGICQLVQHVALDAATQGFKDAMTDALGDAVTFDEQNAQNDPAICATIANGFVSSGVDLILANATPALQAAAAATNEIPILGTSVTEYGVALELDDFDGTVGGNISGTSDLAPLEEQAAMLQELFPDAQNVGLLYCSAEPNSQYQVDVVKAALEEMGYTCELYSFSDSNDLSAVTTTAADASDVIYIPTSTTSASRHRFRSLPARKASAPDAALRHSPSATMTSDTQPARWLYVFLQTARTSPQCRSSTLRNSQRNTTLTSAHSLALRFRATTWQSALRKKRKLPQRALPKR